VVGNSCAISHPPTKEINGGEMWDRGGGGRPAKSPPGLGGSAAQGKKKVQSFPSGWEGGRRPPTWNGKGRVIEYRGNGGERVQVVGSSVVGWGFLRRFPPLENMCSECVIFTVWVFSSSLV